MVPGSSQLLGLIVSDITNPFFPELIHGFEQVAVQSGYEGLLASTSYDPALMATMVRRMIERKAEAAFPGAIAVTARTTRAAVGPNFGIQAPLHSRITHTPAKLRAPSS